MRFVPRSLLAVVAALAVASAASGSASAIPSGDDPSPDPDTEPTGEDPVAPDPILDEADPASEEPLADRGDTDVETAPPMLYPRPGRIDLAARVESVQAPTPTAAAGELASASRVSVAERPTFVPVPPSTAGVSATSPVISEIMFNPAAVYDSRGEYFEIHNPADTSLDLSGWTFGDETYDRHTITSLTIPAGGDAVLTRFGEFARNGGVGADYVYGDSVLLFNVGDQLILRDAGGNVVDAVDYSLDGFPRPAGRSISLRSPEVDNALGTNWCVSTTPLPSGDMGSPGAANQCESSSARLVITEILNNPARTSDFVGEWFEVLNTGATSVDLFGFRVQDDDGESFTISEHVDVAPAERAVLAVSGDTTVNGATDADVVYGDAMRLHNSYDELVLIDPLGIEVDAVRWDDGHTFPDPNGESMHLLDPALDNADGENWCVSARRWATGDFGSPGGAGDCTEIDHPDVVITEVMFDPERSKGERAGEWFELANTGDEPAVLDGYLLRTYSTRHQISSLTIEAGERAVLASSGDLAKNGGLEADYVFGTDLPLYNTTSTLELVAPDATLIDRVRWTERLGFPNDKGHSIELMDVSVDNVLGANWCSTTDQYGDGDFGTPGVAGRCDEPFPAAPLMISEVMRNPATVSDTLGEWIEIHNPTREAVDLRNWSISDDKSDFHVITRSIVVEPGGHAVIARSDDVTRNGGVDADYSIGGAMVLVNAGDTVILADPHGQFVDSVTWGSDDLLPRPNGGSISRSTGSLAAFAPSDDSSQWCVTGTQYGAGDRGTPGLENDCVALPQHAITINEIHRDPKVLPDAQGEWIELHNAGDVDIDISGWTLRDDDVDSYTFDPTRPVVVPAGGYLVAGRNTEALNGGIEIDVQYGVEFIHYNTADEVLLLDRELTVVDRVAWTATNGFPKVSGATMALRSPELNNAVGANWCASVTDQGNGDLGTPGAPNVCELPDPEPMPAPYDQYALFATGGPSCDGDIRLNGSELFVGSPIRSNDGFSVNGSVMTVVGQVSHAGAADVGWGAQLLGGIVQETSAQDVPFDWTLSDFAPGGREAVAAGDAYTFHDGDLRINANGVELDRGIHYVAGDVQINTKDTLLADVTIVATGAIKINSTSVSLSTYRDGLPALFAGESRCNKDGVKIASSTLTVTGGFYAPGSRIKVNGSMLTATDSTFVGSSVQINGSTIVINRPQVTGTGS